MLPVLLDLKIVKIYTFGVFLLLGFFWGMFLFWKMFKLTSYKEEDIFDGLFMAILGGLFFGRLVYVVINFSQFGWNILKFILINGYPGLSLYGALIGGLLFFWVFLRLKKLPFLSTVDYGMPGLFLSIGIAKIGAFLSGSEIGTTTDFFLKVIYVGQVGYRHLSSLYEGLLFLAGVHVSYRILLLVRRAKLPHGFGWYFFCCYFGLVYLLLDKAKANHLYLVGFNFNFWLSALLVALFSLYFAIFFRRGIFQILRQLIIAIMDYVQSTFKTKTRGVQGKTHQGRGIVNQKN